MLTETFDRISFRNRKGALLKLAAVAGLVLTGATAASASDYYHTCRTVDGQYVIEDDALRRAGANGAGTGAEISYTTEKTIVLSERRGYCIGSNTARRHGFEARTYVKEISFWSEGRKISTTALCELASDGLPASTNCRREVVTSNWAITPQSPPPRSEDQDQSQSNPDPRTLPGGSLWMHNGSVMRLVADGDIRRFYYERPRAGIRRRGVVKGELLFEGRREANSYTGTAYIFTKSCGKVAYSVSGSVGPADTTVTMTGDAPRLNASCVQTGSRPDRLVFTLRR